VEALEAKFRPDEIERLKHQFRLWAVPLQKLPPLPEPRPNPGFGRWTGHYPVPPGPWGECEYIGGRGAAKSTVACNWALDQLELFPRAVGAIVAPTKDALWGTCVEHPDTGLLAWARPHFPLRVRATKSSGHEIFCPRNGARAVLLTAERTESFRTTNNLSWAWLDELGACRSARRLWELLRHSVRRGNAQILLTTNPARGMRLINEIASLESAAVVQLDARDNPNTPRVYFEQQILPLIGTSRESEVVRGLQLDEDPNALFRREWIKHLRIQDAEALTFKRIGIGYDPAETSKKSADDSGIVVVGLTADGDGVVLADGTAGVVPGATKPTPGQNARKVVELYWRWSASFVTIDAVRNGETQRDLIFDAARDFARERAQPECATVRVILHGGRETKEAIAVPVASDLYQKGRVKHVTGLDDLERQMTTWTPDERWSPDRMDAACAVLRELMLKKEVKFDTSDLNQPGRAPRRELGWSRGGTNR
jgi:phage terminase large subunit-like protein